MGTEDPWGEEESFADMNYDPSGVANSTPTIPPPPNEMPPPPISRPKSSAPPPPQAATVDAQVQPAAQVSPTAQAASMVISSQTQPKGSSFPIGEILEKIYCSRIAVLISLGFLMLIISAAYANSAGWSNPPDMPVSSDFDLDDDGLSNAESENYNNALDQYGDDLDEYNDKVRDHTGKTLFWMNVGSAFIVGGLVALAISSKGVEMSNSVRVILLIGAIYMLGGLLGYQLPLTGASELALDFGAD